MRPAIALLILAVGFSASLGAHPASAASITQISYVVTGGTFGQGPGATAATGPITGGSVTVNLPGAGVSTPPFWSCSGASACGTAVIVMSGAAGYVKATLPISWAFISAGFASFSRFTGASVPMLSGAAPPGGAASASVWRLSAAAGVGYAGINGTFTQVGPYSFQGIQVHYASIGNEVRVQAPEPSTAALLGLGAAVLGLASGGRRSLKRLLNRS